MGVRSRGKKDSHSECTDLELVEKAGKIVYRDIMHSPLNDGRLVSPESQINSAVPNLLEYTHESLPATLVAIIAESCGKGFLRIPPKFCSQDLLEEDADESGAEDSNVLRLYFSGTSIAKAALGSRYLPPHALKLFQFLKAHRVGEIPMRSLSRIGLCLSDMHRWKAEQTVVR